MSGKKKILAVFGILIILLALAYGFKQGPISVDTAKAVRGAMRVTVEEEGKTRTTDRFVVISPASGYLKRISLNVGDAVKKSQTVATIVPSQPVLLDGRQRDEADARVKASKSNLLIAEENAVNAVRAERFAKNEYDRTKKLYDSGYSSKENLDMSESEMLRTQSARKSAELAVLTAKHDLEMAESALKPRMSVDSGSSIPVPSPVAGRVLKIVRKSEGAVVSGETLLELADTRSLEVEVDVLSGNAVKITSGMKVVLDRWGGESALEGRVRTVEPHGFTKVSALGVEEQRVLVIVEITSPREQWKRLADGYRVEAVFILSEGENILQAPSSALFRRNGGWAVYVVKGDQAELRTVTVGRRNGLSAEIVSGVNDNEEVITHPDSAIRHGSKIKRR